MYNETQISRNGPLLAIKLRQYGAVDLSDAEIRRCFAGCASPIICTCLVEQMIEEGRLSIENGVVEYVAL